MIPNGCAVPLQPHHWNRPSSGAGRRKIPVPTGSDATDAVAAGLVEYRADRVAGFNGDGLNIRIGRYRR